MVRSVGILALSWRILASKTLPKASKTPPRRVQEPSRRPQKRSRCPQEPPGCILGASVRSAILREFCSWRVPGNLGSSRPPRRLQQPPGRLQEPPRRFQDASKMPSAISKTRPGRVQYAPRTSKTPKMSPEGFSPLGDFKELYSSASTQYSNIGCTIDVSYHKFGSFSPQGPILTRITANKVRVACIETPNYIGIFHNRDVSGFSKTTGIPML